MEWEGSFKFDPPGHYCGDGVYIDFEELYQAFKKRFMEEVTVGGELFSADMDFDE